MIKIKVSGFKDQTIEFEQPNEALLFLTELRQEHTDYLSPLIRELEKPNWLLRHPSQKSMDIEPERYPFIPFKNGVTYADNHPVKKSEQYRERLKAVTKQHPLKVEIVEFDDDMSDLI